MIAITHHPPSGRGPSEDTGPLVSSASRMLSDLVLHDVEGLDFRGRLDYFRGLVAAGGSMLDAVARSLGLGRGLGERSADPAIDLVAALAFGDSPRPARGQGDDVDPEEAEASARRYRLIESAGRGGMATVWRAYDSQRDEEVALKVLDMDPEYGSRPEWQLFLAEARVHAKVRHPHVVEIYDMGRYVGGEIDGRPYFTMRWMEGGTLAELPGDTPVREIVELIRQAAEGLQAVHELGSIHRDVKPANLLVEWDRHGQRHVRLSDFGICTVPDDDSGCLAGTPAFVAPELLEDPTALDFRVDIYALGVTLYRLIAGRLPFRGDSLGSILRDIWQSKPPALQEWVPGVSEELQSIVDRCLAKDPSRRYGSARELSADLERWLARSPARQ